MYKNVQKCTKNVQRCTVKICRGDRIDAKCSEVFQGRVEKQTASFVGKNKFSWQEVSCLMRVVIVAVELAHCQKTPFKRLYIMNLMTNLLNFFGRFFGKNQANFPAWDVFLYCYHTRMLSRNQAFCSDRGKNGAKSELKHFSIHFGFIDLFI